MANSKPKKFKRKKRDFVNPPKIKGEFHVSAHGQTLTAAHLIPFVLKQSKALMQKTETIP